MHGYTTWIVDVGLGHWRRSGLSGDGDGEEVFGGVSGCERENIFLVFGGVYLGECLYGGPLK